MEKSYKMQQKSLDDRFALLFQKSHLSDATAMHFTADAQSTNYLLLNFFIAGRRSRSLTLVSCQIYNLLYFVIFYLCLLQPGLTFLIRIKVGIKVVKADIKTGINAGIKAGIKWTKGRVQRRA